MKNPKGFLLYRIYYGDQIVYVGRTKQDLQSRIRGHLLAKPMHKAINIDLVTKIEYASFSTESDMVIYEVYFINLWHPPINRDDKAKDNPTIQLPEVEWKVFETPLWEKWVEEISEKDRQRDEHLLSYRQIPNIRQQLRSQFLAGEITEEQYGAELDRIYNEKEELKQQLWG